MTDPDGRLAAPPPPAAPLSSGVTRGALLILAVLLLPPAMILFVFPLVQNQPFDGRDDLRPADIRSLRVYLFVRKEIAPELDGKPDVGPYYADAADLPALLAPLAEAKEVPEFDTARGPLLGEYRIVTTENRRADPVRLYWVRPRGLPPDRPAVLRFQIGPRKYEGGSALAVVQAAEAAAPRGRAKP